MAGVLAQKKASAEFNEVTTFNVTFDNAVVAGNHVVVCTSSWKDGTDQSVSTIADNKGNGNYSIAVDAPRIDSQTIGSLFYKNNITTGGTTFTITVTWNTSGCSGVVGALEYSGIATGGAVGVSNNSGSSTTPSSGAAVPGAASTCVAMMSYNTGGPSTIAETAANFAEQLEIDENNDKQDINIADGVGLSGSQTCTWSLSNTGTWTACIAAFEETAAAGGSIVPILQHQYRARGA